MNQAELIPLLSGFLPFWEHLTAAQQELLVWNTAEAHYGKNSAIHCGLQDCAGILLFRRGTARAYMLSEDGREITLFRMSEGEVCILSASCVLNAITFDVHVDTISECDLLRINSAVFSKLQEENIYVEAFIYRLAAERFSDVMWTMQQILFMSFDRRLAIFLIDESAKTGSDALKITHEQIARYMGSAREVVTRMLKYFSAEGLVELSRGGVRLLDKKRLKKIAGG